MKKIALYKDVTYDWESVCEATEYMEEDSEKVRISEIKEVEFDLLPYGEAEKLQIELIDKEITKTRADAEVKINNLEMKKAELLAITSE